MTINDFNIKDYDDEDIIDGSTVIVKCKYNHTNCPSDDIFDCTNIKIISSIDCSKIKVWWATYLIYKQHFEEAN
jgi:hypothetical protein